MREIFGIQTKMTKHEEDVINAILPNNRVVAPEFLYGKPRIHILDSVKAEKSSFEGAKELDFFSNGIIIPFDTLDLKRTKFNDLRGNNVCKREKFIGRPDFFFVHEGKEELDVYPIDIKAKVGARDTLEHRAIKQISPYNAYHLFLYSDYLNQTLRCLEYEYGKEIVLHSGCFLAETGSKDKTSLEWFIRRNIHKAVPEKYAKIENLGVNFSQWPPSLMVASETPVIADMFVDCKELKDEPMLREYLRNVKDKISQDGYYPNDVVVVSGFNGGNKAKRRLEFIANKTIETLDPFIDSLTDRIETLLGISHKDILEKYEETLIKTQEEKLTRLEYSLETKQRQNERYADRSYDIKTTGEVGAKRRIPMVEHCRKRIIETSKETNELKSVISQAKSVLQRDRERVHKLIQSKSSADIYYESEDKRSRLILACIYERHYLETALKKRHKKDATLKNRMKLFRRQAELSIEQGSYFSAPREIYLQLGNQKTYQVLMYPALSLNK